MTATAKKEFRLTGWHVLAGFIAAFGVIIAVNVTLAVKAVRTFPGLETAHAYRDSQTFDVRRAAQEALGWSLRAVNEGDRLVLSITDAEGKPVQAGSLEVLVGRPTNVSEDRRPSFTFDGRAYVARESLSLGNWDLWIKARALDGTPFEQRLALTVGH